MGKPTNKHRRTGASSLLRYEPAQRMDYMERLGAKVIPQPNGCWAVNGELNRYHRFRGHPAHRWVYEAINGPLQRGVVVHHKCENKGCINPAHLTLMTRSDHSSHHATLQHAASPRPPGS